jgi:hypothetical protein
MGSDPAFAAGPGEPGRTRPADECGGGSVSPPQAGTVTLPNVELEEDPPTGHGQGPEGAGPVGRTWRCKVHGRTLRGERASLL